MAYDVDKMNKPRDRVQELAGPPKFAFGPYHPAGRNAVDAVNEVSRFVGRYIGGEEEIPESELDAVLQKFEQFIPSAKAGEGRNALTAYLKGVRTMLKKPNAVAGPTGEPTVGEIPEETDMTTAKPGKKPAKKKTAKRR